MRLLKRAGTGFVIMAITIGMLAFGGWRLQLAVQSKSPDSRGGQRERTFTVDAGTLLAVTHAPKITAYGQVQAWTNLEIRAPASGPVTEISANMRDGMSVTKGEVLFRIDPEIAGRRVTDARAALTQAQTELAEARESLKHIDAEIAAAKMQAGVRRRDLERKQSLFDKKLVTAAAIDEIRLAVSAADQTIVAKEQARVAATSRIEKATSGIDRSTISLNDAERGWQDTTYRAPFDGRLTDVALTLGRRVAQNEKLALLIDPSALEVSFPVRNIDFGNLLDSADATRLAPLAISATLDLADKDISVAGVLDRPAAVASSQTGRTVFARLHSENAAALRPGDFVTVTITEPAMSNVAVIPADAATVDGRILLIGADRRLTDHQARIMRRQNDTLVVADVPFGSAFVRRRLPYLAQGLKVNPRDISEQPAAPPVAAGPAAPTAGEGEAADGIAIDDKRRAALIAHVKANTSMPEERRAKLVDELTKPMPSRRVIEHIEKRLVRAETRS